MVSLKNSFWILITVRNWIYRCPFWYNFKNFQSWKRDIVVSILWLKWRRSQVWIYIKVYFCLFYVCTQRSDNILDLPSEIYDMQEKSRIIFQGAVFYSLLWLVLKYFFTFSRKGTWTWNGWSKRSIEIAFICFIWVT